MTTRMDGKYGFVGLDPAQKYQVQFVAPPGTDARLNGDFAEPQSQTGLFTVNAGEFKDHVDGGLVDVSQRPMNKIVGPGVVPGNSEYEFTIRTNGPVGSWGIEVVDPVNPPPKVAEITTFSRLVGFETVRVRFSNEVPAVVRLKAFRDANGRVLIDSKEIVVVKVSVETPAVGALVYGTPFDAGVSGNPALKIVASGKPFGLEWKAKVTLEGPQGNRGVDQIKTGFVQHISIKEWRGRYVVRDPNDASLLVANFESQTFLDMGGDNGTPGPNFTNRPWYDRQLPAVFFDATSSAAVKTISSLDRPGSGSPLTFEQASQQAIRQAIARRQFDQQFRRLEHLDLVWSFDLDVAAATIDTANGANNSFWGQSRVNWTFNGTGNVGQSPFFAWSPDGAGVAGDVSWDGLPVTPEDIGGDPFNKDLLFDNELRFSSKQR